MKGFPEDIMPDGKSGIFSTSVPHNDTPGLENAADTAKRNHCHGSQVLDTCRPFCAGDSIDSIRDFQQPDNAA